MLTENLRRPGRHDPHSASHTAIAAVEAVYFLLLEELEPRTYGDAATFTTAAAMFTTAGPTLTVDGGGSASLPSAPYDNGHTLLGLTQMWSDPRFAAFRGAGMRSVLLDTGINNTSPFFGPDADGNGVADRIVYQYDFANNDADATDTMGHGSNVASAVASGDAAHGGIAPEADVIALRVFNDAGAGSFTWLERGLQWVIAHAAEYNIVSVNMSLGDGRFWTGRAGMYGVGDELATLAGMGVIVTAAAGNGFYDGGSRVGLSYPAADPNVISVGAVYGQEDEGFGYSGGAIANSSHAGALTPFTQRGPTLDILAPGAPVVGASAGTGLSVMHGTSQAAPQIAGLALLAQQMASQLLGRRLSVAEFRQILTISATTVIDGDDEDDNVVNTGANYRLANAMEMAETIWSMRTVAAVVANSAPDLTGFETLAGAITNRAAVIDYATLARAAHVSDDDGDTIGFSLDQVSGTLTINGRTVQAGSAVVMPGDCVVWTPPTDATGDQVAFVVRAFDGVDYSGATADVTVNVADRADNRFVRGIRLVSDEPDALGPASAAVASATQNAGDLPTVTGLRFLDFTTDSDAGHGRVASASEIVAPIARIAA